MRWDLICFLARPIYWQLESVQANIHHIWCEISVGFLTWAMPDTPLLPSRAYLGRRRSRTAISPPTGDLVPRMLEYSAVFSRQDHGKASQLCWSRTDSLPLGSPMQGSDDGVGLGHHVYVVFVVELSRVFVDASALEQLVNLARQHTV